MTLMIMSIFNIPKKAEQIQGSIGYFGLSDWWMETFSETEREYIIKTYRPLGWGGESLIKGSYSYINGS